MYVLDPFFNYYVFQASSPQATMVHGLEARVLYQYSFKYVRVGEIKVPMKFYDTVAENLIN